MRILPPAFLCLLATLASCRAHIHSSLPTTADDLPSTLFVIDPSRDTTLTTPGGAIVNIPKGALDAGAGAAVQLEVKEAYTIEDMLRGGLGTRSKGALLASGGMIYLNVAGGTNATLRKPIFVQVPTRNWQPDMQRYKGEPDDDGRIDWVDPSLLDTSNDEKDFAAGKAIFQTNCAPCHALSATVIGPPLAFITQRRDPKWLYAYIRNSNRMRKIDAYSCWLFERYNKTPMSIYSVLSDPGMKALFEYIAIASRKLDSNKVVDEKRHYDSCLNYTRQRYSLELQREYQSSDSGKGLHPNYDSLTDALIPAFDRNDSTTDSSQPISYYGFSIDKLGWYNVDRLLKQLPAVIESELRVKVTGRYRQSQTVYLVIPSMNVIADGASSEDKGDEYTFLGPDGTLPLPQSTVAYILTLGKVQGQVTIGKTRWITGRSQKISVEPTQTSKTVFNEAISEMHLEALKTFEQPLPPLSDSTWEPQVIHSNTQRDSAIRKLQSLRPAGCHCDCIIGGELCAWITRQDSAVSPAPR